MKVSVFFELLKSAFTKWSKHKAPRLGASLAFYTLLSTAPLMILAVAICGLAFGQATAQQNVIDQAEMLLGPGGAGVLRMLLQNAHRPGTGIFASSLAILTLLFGASGVFLELRDSLNEIWDAPPNESSGLRSMVLQRLASFGMVLSLGFLLLTSLVVSAWLGIVERFFSGFFPINATMLECVNFVVSTLTIGILFALIFKFVPEVRIDWQDVGIGAGATAVLFMAGKSLLAFYLSTAGVGSAYGAAGSVVIFVVWVYYSAQIFFFGAVFTRVYAVAYGSRKNKKRVKSAAQNPGGIALA